MKSISIFTASRSEYGIWRKLINTLLESQLYDINLFLAGKLPSDITILDELACLANQNSNFRFEKAPLIDEIITDMDISVSISKTLISFTQYITNNKIDALFVLGDRYELFAPVLAAYYSKIPIFHFHGGEKTFGSLDDSARHAISKLANYHFVCNESYAKRLIQLGENTESIFNVGSLSIDRLSDLVDSIKSKNVSSSKSILVAFNPVTNESLEENISYLNILLNVSRELIEFNFKFTSSNEDSYSLKMNEYLIQNSKSVDNVDFVGNLGYERFYTTMLSSFAILGNSSSGIIDAPFLKIPSINIGNRQEGRLFSDSVSTVAIDKDLIVKKIKQLDQSYYQYYSLYGDKGASLKVLNIIKKLDFTSNLKKYFNDNF